MAFAFVIGEDALCCALGTRLINDINGWVLAQPAINCNGITKLCPSLRRYMGLTNMHPVVCIADTDGKCVRRILEAWLPPLRPRDFMFRLAVTEAESWLLADREGLAKFLDIASKHIPRAPDVLIDPKRMILSLAAKSRRRYVKREMISESDSSRPGIGYNQHLSDFVASHWRPALAAEESPSLARAVGRLREASERN